MSSANDTGFTPSTLILTGIPGLEAFHIWFAAPLCIIYIVTALGNCTVIVAIKRAPSLQKPMYIFISQLAFCDLVISSCTAPKTLGIFWCNAGEISLPACLIQMFFIISILVLSSSILSAMAFDRYVAVCNPLRYYSIITNSLIAKIAAASLARAIFLIAPLPLMILKLPFCRRHIAHTYCENLAVAKLSCSDINASSVYAFAIAFSLAPVDITCIAISYILILSAIVRLPHREARSKAFSICGSHICVMSALYVPLFFVLTVNRFQQSIPFYLPVIAGNIYLTFPPLMNPFIYSVTMKEMRQGVLQIFQR